jgi:hypothetical protein
MTARDQSVAALDDDADLIAYAAGSGQSPGTAAIAAGPSPKKVVVDPGFMVDQVHSRGICQV